MEARLRIGDRVYAVSAREVAPGRIRLEVDGEAEEVEYVGALDGGHLVSIGGALAPLWTVATPDGTWVWHRGRARLVEPDEAAPSPAGRTPAPRGAGASAPGEPRPIPAPRSALAAGAVTPPMPAVVVAVLVEVGQAVTRGTPLVVVSAMKTETQLAAPVDGLVSAVNTRVGAKVRPGDVLVEIAPGGGDRGG